MLAFHFSGGCPYVYVYVYGSINTPKLNETQIAANLTGDTFTSSNRAALMVPAGGALTVTVGDEGIDAIRLSCGGSLQLPGASVPVVFSCDMGFAPRDFAVPEAVAAAIAR